METASDKLGAFLASLRKQKGLSLREVESRTGISNAYLSQVENGKIREPSPGNLFKLSELYGVSYAELLEQAGYPVPGRSARGAKESLIGRLGPVTNEEEEALADYLKFLRSRKRGAQ
jgi:transcriptional regulator with XRE-family HTH domain